MLSLLFIINDKVATCNIQFQQKNNVYINKEKLISKQGGNSTRWQPFQGHVLVTCTVLKHVVGNCCVCVASVAFATKLVNCVHN